ncbi:MAG: propionyl-CoA synthetase [Syntrophorhabdales bacterium]|jgi:propionyl-CoA synthetase
MSAGTGYSTLYERSINDREGFWGEAADAISWTKRWDKVVDGGNKPFYRWFTGGELNTCYNAVDIHVENGRGDQVAIIYDSPVTGTIQRIRYRELQEAVSRFAGALKARGIEKGDRVVIYMPMIPQALTAMLACARIGAIHSVVFGGFAPNELAKRINDAFPRVIVSASCGIEGGKVIPYKPLLDKAIESAERKPEACIIYQRPQAEAQLIQGRDFEWETVMGQASPAACVPVSATDPLYVLYTSGTTGMPKGVVRDNGGHAVALKWSMKYFYGVEPGEVFWAASDIGWVVGHSYIVYAPLLAGCTTVLYEGKPVGTPDPGAFWRTISEHGVSVFFTAPTALRAIKREDPKGEFLRKYDIGTLRYLFLAGERLDLDTYHWARELLGIPVIDHWWQTETGWAIAGNCMGIEPLPVKAGSPTKAVPGYDIQIVDEDGKKVPAGTDGVVAIRLPLPPGCLSTLWNNDEKFLDYLRPIPGFYVTGDSGHFDEDGYLFIMGRIDEVINVAGHRLSTGAMEEIVARHPDVAECAVLGVEDQLKGQLPFGFVVLKAGSGREHGEVTRELVQMVRAEIGPVACFNMCLVVDALPKTRSGKILRGTMSRIVDGKEYQVPSTIDDPGVLGRIEEAVKRAGSGKGRKRDG